ncbi:MAG: hypothetical protein ACT4NP_02215 [Pseudonocardiales bacterium]
MAVGVLDGQRGLADPAQAVQSLRHRRAVCQQGTAQVREQRVAASEPGAAGGHIPDPTDRRPLRLGSRQFDQCLIHRRMELLRAAGRHHCQSGVEQPGAERLLASAVFGINEQIPRAFRRVVEQEYQARQVGLTGGLELQLGVGQLRAVAYR